MSSATMVFDGAMMNNQGNGDMTNRFHIAVVATVVAAALAVGIASAATLPAQPVLPAKKADRLPTASVVSDTVGSGYVTIETRSDNTSVLARVPLD